MDPLAPLRDIDPDTFAELSESQKRLFEAVPAPAHKPISGYVFDDTRRTLYLEALASSGRKYYAAALVGVSCITVNRHIAADTDFAACVEEALEAYKDKVRQVIQRRALEGDLVPVIGRVGRDKDGIIAYTRKFSDNLLAMEAKRIDPEYREKAQVDVTVKHSGVLVVAAAPSTLDWESQHSGQRLPADPLVGLPGITPEMVQSVMERGRELDVIDGVAETIDEGKS